MLESMSQLRFTLVGGNKSVGGISKQDPRNRSKLTRMFFKDFKKTLEFLNDTGPQRINFSYARVLPTKRSDLSLH